jgi:hypothetical protein
MEFFKIVKVKTSEESIQEHLTLSALENFSNEIFPLDEPQVNDVEIGGIWGEFTLNRAVIKGGIRFSLVECPNALCWTITTGYPPERNSVVIHLTINRKRKHPEFVEEIEEFLEDHCTCLENFFSDSARL